MNPIEPARTVGQPGRPRISDSLFCLHPPHPVNRVNPVQNLPHFHFSKKYVYPPLPLDLWGSLRRVPHFRFSPPLRQPFPPLRSSSALRAKWSAAFLRISTFRFQLFDHPPTPPSLLAGKAKPLT